MKKSYFKLSIISISILAFSGCTSMKDLSIFQDDVDEKVVQEQKIQEKAYVANSYDNFEKELIRIASKSEETYNSFYHLLKQRKQIEFEKQPQHIPYGMGKKITTTFEGYSGLLVKTMAEKSDYKLVTEDISLFDTRLVSKEYKNTTINDILLDLSQENGFNIVVKEKERVIVIKAEE